jgi:hypothetical protein
MMSIWWMIPTGCHGNFFFKKKTHEFLCHVKKALGDGLFTPHLVSTQGKAKGGENCLQIYNFKKKKGN